jgi:hypothetical protein
MLSGETPRGFQGGRSQAFKTDTQLIVDRCTVHVRHQAGGRVDRKLFGGDKFGPKPRRNWLESLDVEDSSGEL